MSAVLQDFHTWAPDQGKEFLKVCVGGKVSPQHTSALGAGLIWALALAVCGGFGRNSGFGSQQRKEHQGEQS